MGRNNQQRRRAKAKARAQARTSWRAHSHDADDHHGSRHGLPTAHEQAMRHAFVALRSVQEQRPQRAETAYGELLVLAATPSGRRAVTSCLASLLAGPVTEAWRRGWQPADVHRLAERQLDDVGRNLVADAMAAELAQYSAASVPPRWAGQLREAGASVWWSRDTDLLDARARSSGGLGAILPHLMRAVVYLMGLPPIQQLDPLPGQTQANPAQADPAQANSARTRRPHVSTGPGAGGPEVDERILSRVRALLAKAESTTYAAEAETFTAGAQALMSRHSIDAAMLAAAGGSAGQAAPGARRVGIDRPYERPKVLLLGAVAEANRCRTVWSESLAFVTVVGFEGDLQAVETLFTSLLIQSTRAMTQQGSRVDRGGRSRTRSFRQSFLTAFASRIGQRLQEVAAEETVAAQSRSGGFAGPGRDLARVLESRVEDVDDAVSELFPGLTTRSLGSASDAEGWFAGTQAADAASLFGEQLSRPRAHAQS